MIFRITGNRGGSFWGEPAVHFPGCNYNTLQGRSTYPTKREKENHRLKSDLGEDMCVSRRAYVVYFFTWPWRYCFKMTFCLDPFFDTFDKFHGFYWTQSKRLAETTCEVGTFFACSRSLLAIKPVSKHYQEITNEHTNSGTTYHKTFNLSMKSQLSCITHIQ